MKTSLTALLVKTLTKCSHGSVCSVFPKNPNFKVLNVSLMKSSCTSGFLFCSQYLKETLLCYCYKSSIKVRFNKDKNHDETSEKLNFGP